MQFKNIPNDTINKKIELNSAISADAIYMFYIDVVNGKFK